MEANRHRSVTQYIEESIEALREAFKDRVTKGEFTITEQEASDLLNAPVNILLQSFSNLGKFLEREKANRLMFYEADEVVNDLLPKFIAKEQEKAEQSRTKRLWAKHQTD